MQTTVGISEFIVSQQKDEVLVTYALGSCLGVTIFDPVAHVAGMIHCMLPLSSIDKNKAQDRPAMFIDTGIPLLFKQAYELGAKKDRMIVKVAGGSRIHDDNGHFKIGERNYITLRKILWKNNVLIKSEDVGGSISRTLYMEVSTGRVTIRTSGQITEL
jgi:chemotaxis protein CheD